MELVYKNLGETPLQALERYRIEAKIDQNIPMTYAGRLDPMAEGVLIILVGEECKEKNKYNNLDKEYEVEVLIGLETDTYDLLGILQRDNDFKKDEIEEIVNKVKDPELVKDLTKKFIQEYPKFSSKRLFKENEEEIPTKEVEIYKIDFLNERQISREELYNEIKNRVDLVKGDFRQDLILGKWADYFKGQNIKSDIESDRDFTIIKIRVLCSSGTYMRSLASSLGSLAYSIKRTRILV